MSLTPEQQELITHMEAFKTMRSQMNIAAQFHYKGMEHFLLEHGQWHEVQPWTSEYEQGAPRQCFGNALLQSVTNGLRYVEGLAIAENLLAFPIHHAWNLDQRGKVVDNTWLNAGTLYFGVEFSVGRADDAIWNGDSNVLDDYMRRHPLFRQPWTGEDYSKKWEPSDGMKLATQLLKEQSA